MQVSIMDEVVGNILDALTAKGMYDNLFIAFSSDNGGYVATYVCAY
jgi:arylsulfatase A-like enzyme